MSTENCFDESCLKEELQKFAVEICKGLLPHGIELKVEKNCAELRLDSNSKIEYTENVDKSHGHYYFRRKDKNDKYFWEEYYIPHADNPGVYLFFDKDEKALYVGQSATAMGRRIATHVGERVGDEFPDLAFEGAEYVIFIPFDEEAAFLAPAFESYLLKRFKFEHNARK